MPSLCVAHAGRVALLVQVWQNAHYAAPVTGLVILIAIVGMRRLGLWHWNGHRVGLAFVRLVPIALAAMLMIQIAAGPGEASWRWAAISWSPSS